MTTDPTWPALVIDLRDITNESSEYVVSQAEARAILAQPAPVCGWVDRCDKPESDHAHSGKAWDMPDGGKYNHPYRPAPERCAVCDRPMLSNAHEWDHEYTRPTLDAAWARAEAALPEGWVVRSIDRPAAPEYVHRSIVWVEEGIDSRDRTPLYTCGGHTPQAALSALADALEARK